MPVNNCLSLHKILADIHCYIRSRHLRHKANKMRVNSEKNSFKQTLNELAGLYSNN